MIINLCVKKQSRPILAKSGEKMDRGTVNHLNYGSLCPGSLCPRVTFNLFADFLLTLLSIINLLCGPLIASFLQYILILLPNFSSA